MNRRKRAFRNFQYICLRMKSIILTISFVLLFSLTLDGQITQERNLDRSRQTGQQQGQIQGVGNGGDEEETSQKIPKSTIKRKVENWVLSDNFTRADTIPVDTISQGFQIHNPAFREAMANVQLGNLGAPWKSAMVSGMPVYTRFLFTENLSNFFAGPETWRYYNTRTPYTNLYYQYSGPKRRSEESVNVLFTQNINKNWNAGFNYQLISSIGKYEAQKVENRHFRFFSSYSGIIYQIHGSFVFNRTDHLENGGLMDDNDILIPERKDEYAQSENIPVKLYSASNRTDNFQLFINQSLDVGNISIASRDGESTKLPVGTANHILHIDRSRRIHKITDIGRYRANDPASFFYPNIYADSLATLDSVYYVTIKNTFQLKFNEEANSLLRFGLRVYITNNVEKYRFPLAPVKFDSITLAPKYLLGDTTFTTTYIGGQIFKNLGENLKWNAGFKLYFQGYRTGDSEITGEINSRFRVRKDTAQVYGNGGIFLVSPDFLTNRYYSNHILWQNRFNPVKTVKARGGINIPTRRIELSGEIRLINDFIFWDQEALPTQSSAYIKLIELRLFKHFKLGNFHSRNTILYQISSNQEIIPLPEYSIYSSNYYQNTLFKVLFFQLGFDTRYTSAWYTPNYMPATGQFHLQEIRKIGDYPYVDVFLNMQLKRARIFIKMDHVNQGMLNNNYFHTIGYPVNPRGLRFGVSWNFYD